jgi:hypothetical protein
MPREKRALRSGATWAWQTLTMQIHHFLFLVLLLFSRLAFAQGSLTPPGAPGPSMKTLQQIEARTPISSLPFTISASGSYYLTGNLEFSAASGDAIIIAVSNVTLDLNGFTLSSTAAVTGDAIQINADLRNVEIKNGVIAGTTTMSAPPDWMVTPGGFNNGIHAVEPEATNCVFRQLRISGCRNTGLDTGDVAIVEHVTATQNGSDGIHAERAAVSNSNSSFNGRRGIYAQSSSVTNSLAAGNGDEGIVGHFGVVAFCLAYANAGANIDAASATRTGNNPAP